ncbi:uncharacterized protein G2W53_039406 [Senna tora]|uniref:Uncharacterized protein n=1 Tax=Senna tora TaxID=362788 RepID=A0A834W2U0_9FABA|nr:uncharacterized protein G2W53_039406 [Senna tora]
MASHKDLSGQFQPIHLKHYLRGD